MLTMSPFLWLALSLLSAAATASPAPSPSRPRPAAAAAAAAAAPRAATTSSSSQGVVVLPLLVLQGAAFATPVPSSPDSLTAAILGSSNDGEDDEQTTYLVGCEAQSRDAACGLPGGRGAQYTITAARSTLQQTYINSQLEVTHAQECTLAGTASPTSYLTVSSTTFGPVPASASCTASITGLPPAHSDQTYTLGVDDVERYFRTVTITADQRTDSLASSSSTSTSTSTTTSTVEVSTTTSTGEAVTSTSVVVVPAPPTTTIFVTAPPTSSSTSTGGAALPPSGSYAGGLSILVSAAAVLLGALLL